MSETIQHYNVGTRKLEQPTNQKVRKLLELGLVRRITDGLYQCLPIPGYNITTYTIREIMGRLACNCQGYHKYSNCSHVAAVRLYQQNVEHIKEQQLHIL